MDGEEKLLTAAVVFYIANYLAALIVIVHFVSKYW